LVVLTLYQCREEITSETNTKRGIQTATVGGELIATKNTTIMRGPTPKNVEKIIVSAGDSWGLMVWGPVQFNIETSKQKIPGRRGPFDCKNNAGETRET